jgi:hypothetical protein
MVIVIIGLLLIFSYSYLMTMTKYLLFTLALVLIACQKSATDPTLDFGVGEGISFRNNNGMPNGAQDPTDWTTDATWNEQETALFSELSISLNSSQQPSLITFAYAYPNPAKQAIWSVQTSTPSVAYTVTAVLVDSKYQIIKRFAHTSHIGGHNYLLDYAQLGLNSSETYRLYYVLFNNNGLVYKGHGDMRYL